MSLLAATGAATGALRFGAILAKADCFSNYAFIMKCNVGLGLFAFQMQSGGSRHTDCRGLPGPCRASRSAAPGPSGLPDGLFNKAPGALWFSPALMCWRWASAQNGHSHLRPTYARLTPHLRQSGNSRHGLSGALSKPSWSNLAEFGLLNLL